MKVRFLVFLVLSVAAGASLAAYPQVTLQVTGAVNGNIVLELYPDKAPITVTNFLNYVRSGFYNGLIFHRVIDGFMIQGGGYGPDMVKKTSGPPIINESSNGLLNLTGTIAMARTTYAHTATAEFYINVDDNYFLDYDSIIYNYYTRKPHAQIGYCVFGRVLNGMSLVNAIAILDSIDEVPDDERPDVDVIIHSATVTSNEPLCLEKSEGDFDGDCDMDTDDIIKFAIQWMNTTCRGCYSADVNDDGEVNFADFAKISNNWLKCNSITTPCN